MAGKCAVCRLGNNHSLPQLARRDYVCAQPSPVDERGNTVLAQEYIESSEMLSERARAHQLAIIRVRHRQSSTDFFEGERREKRKMMSEKKNEKGHLRKE